MKNFKFLMIMVLGVVLFSCEKENVETVQGSNPPDGSALSAKEGPQTRVDPFQTTLQWTAYAATMALYEYPATREEFIAAFNGNNSVEISALLGSTSVAPEFKARFLDKMYWYIFIEVDPVYPGGNGEKPSSPISQNPPPPPCSDPPCHSNEAQVYLNHFMGEILNDNCIEFYLPDTLVFDEDSLEMTSVAHPLASNDSNFGFRRGPTYFPPSEEGEPGYWIEWISSQTVNNLYESIHNNLIVARPFRPLEEETGLPNEPCTYLDYVANFTLYLD